MFSHRVQRAFNFMIKQKNFGAKFRVTDPLLCRYLKRPVRFRLKVLKLGKKS